MDPEVDKYLVDGCMRCKLGATPECKVNNWRDELKTLRTIALQCGLTEELKWGVPCYTFQQNNVAIISAFKEYAALSFFKGSLLNDTHKLLDKPGESSQAARLIRFTNVREIIKKEAILKAYIFEAMEVEKAGLKVAFKKNPEPIPEEFQKTMTENPEVKAAFETLTPGRQRGYIIYFSQPKQSKTRVSRIEKCIPRMLDGKGLHDR
ncbi:YdeI/OmpD-associated family protein [Fulvivirgaceae bacterium BMA12]|uniref:YdeI/OmpD-associated family protein n=1 Tax=Agaribacillus aureus TaxID=3051825 RepID=A0ABT8L0D6_9BACT|nr:YdeI/OmpD-associated family protein [Fulvivirgaceae bacterium BMA12]